MLPLIGGAVVVVLVAACVWRVRHPRGPSMVVVSRKQAAREPYPYLYVNADGSARELHPNERKYLETPFQGGDGARPYAKRSYSQKKNGWGEVKGYLKRSKLPPGIPVGAAPEQEPRMPLTKADHIEFLRAKGMDVVENSDGSFTVKKPNS
jgi:hypothetical protein